MKRYQFWKTLAAMLMAVTLCLQAGDGWALQAPAQPAGGEAVNLALWSAAPIGVGLVVNASTLSAFFKGLQASYLKGLETAAPQWMKVAGMVNSTGESEDYGWLGDIPGFREWVGERVLHALTLHDYSVKNKDFELTIEVDRNKFMDDKLGMFSTIAQALGEAAGAHPDELVFNALNAGRTSLCFDGQNFFDSDHPVIQADGTVASVANLDSSGGGPYWYLLAMNRSVKPLFFQKRQEYNFVELFDAKSPNVFYQKKFVYGVDSRCNVGYGLWQLAYASNKTLDTTNYEAARQAMMAFAKDHGEPLGIVPDTLVVPTSLEGKALDVVGIKELAGGTTNKYFGTATIVKAPRLPIA